MSEKVLTLQTSYQYKISTYVGVGELQLSMTMSRIVLLFARLYPQVAVNRQISKYLRGRRGLS